MLDQHRKMLADRVRMDAYARAIRAVVKPGDVVVDLGTGTGALAFLAIESGARHVYAIDKTHMADMAMLLVRERGLADRVTVFHDHSSNVELPERADVLVTETLGALGLEEEILASVNDARRMLRDGAAVIPERIALSLVPVEWPALYDVRIGGWDGSPLRTFAANAMYLDAIDLSAHLAAPRTIIETPQTSGRATFHTTRAGVTHGFAGWFTATLAPGIELSNAIPRATHWNHAFLPIEHPIAITVGAAVDVELSYEGGQEWRWRGAIDGTAFDQTTLLSTPPCERQRR